jgi:hypothetical protein
MKLITTIFLAAMITMSSCSQETLRHGNHKHKKHHIVKAKSKKKRTLTPNELRVMVIVGLLLVVTLDGGFNKQQ